MGTKKHTTSSTLFERRVRQSLFRKDRVFLFDQNWSAVPENDGDATIARLARLADLSLYHFDGCSFSEKKMAASLLGPTTTETSKPSIFALLAKDMKNQQQDLIVIHNAHDLDSHAVTLLSRLIKFSRRANMRWKFLLFADTAMMDTTTMFRLSIAQAYPRSIEEIIHQREHMLEPRTEHATKGLKRAGSNFIERLSDRLFG